MGESGPTYLSAAPAVVWFGSVLGPRTVATWVALKRLHKCSPCETIRSTFAPRFGSVHSLAETIDPDTTVLTDNQRLAREIRLGLAARASSGAGAWRTADVLSFDAWIERTWTDHTDRSGEALPSLLNAAQEQLLWEVCIQTHLEAAAGASLLQISGAARNARAAHALLIAWRCGLAKAFLDEDALAFRAWREAFDTRCREAGWIDLASATDSVIALIPTHKLQLNGSVLLAGFDRLSPQQDELLKALQAIGVEAACWSGPGTAANAVRTSFAAQDDELEAAARWARRLLEDGGSGPIGVVVPDLSGVRTTVERIFDDVLRPGAIVTGDESRPRPFNISLGEPLSRVPVIRDGLLALGLGRGGNAMGCIEQLLGSPHLAGAEEEASNRGVLVAELRRLGEPDIPVQLLLTQARRERCHCPVLATGLDRLQHAIARARTQSCADWVVSFSRWLQVVGWPGERTLNASQRQSVDAFGQLLTQFASLGMVTGMLTVGQALAKLQRLAEERMFQPRTEPAPIQVLGVPDSVGLEFSHLWVTGLHDGVWPSPARPNPLLPISLQRRAGLPHSSPEVELARARRTTADWLSSAHTVVLSHPTRAGDAALRPSRLLAEIPFCEPSGLLRSEVLTYTRQLLSSAPGLETLEDFRAPPLAVGTSVRGGATLFKDQAACPFRAFAAHRLGARGLDTTTPGLDAMERGSLVHEILAQIWTQLDGQSALLGLSAERLGDLVAASVDVALKEWAGRRSVTLRGRFAALERRRLEALCLAWLEQEARRSPFEVDASESDALVTIEGLPVRIRPDRVDRLIGDRYLLVDYKTGDVKLNAWFGDRPDEPQLPLYCTALEQAGDQVAGTAFGVLRVEGTGYLGLADDPSIAPGIETLDTASVAAARLFADWQSLKSEWRTTLEGLARDFMRGDARVDPKAAAVCRFCGLWSLCRVRELSALPADEEDSR